MAECLGAPDFKCHSDHKLKVELWWTLGRPGFNSLVYRGGSRGRVQGGAPPSPPPEMTCGFLIQLVFYKRCGLLVLK